MGKLRRVVSLNYPVSRLPADLREGRDASKRVDLVVEEDGPEGSEYETTVIDFTERFTGQTPGAAEPKQIAKVPR